MSDNIKLTITPELLVDYLIKNSTEYHNVSVAEISTFFRERVAYFETLIEKDKDYLEKWDDLFFDEDEGIEQDRVFDTIDESVTPQVRRLLTRMLRKTLPCGMSVWSDDTETDPMHISYTKQAFYIKMLLDETSINLIRDAIEVFPFAEPSKTASIIHNLNMFTHRQNRREFDPKIYSAMKFSGTTYYQNLREIYKAFRTLKSDGKAKSLTREEKKLKQEKYDELYVKEINQISFVYCEYDETKTLKPKPLRNGEVVRTVNPVKLIWTNGYCYLVTAVPSFKDKNKLVFRNYRVDRMTNVMCLDSPSLYKPSPDNKSNPEKHPEANPLQYAQKNPVMYSENLEGQQPVVMLCSRNLINHAIDTFGFDIDLDKTDDPKKIRITIRNTSYAGVKMWALEYGYGCEIISPPQLREEMKKASEHLMKIYQN